MAGFLYFAPTDKSELSAGDLAALGLAYAFDGQHVARGCSAGPGGKRGLVVVADGFDLGRLGYYPDRQEWRCIPKSEIWCGLFKDDRPAPADLARQQPLPGHLVKLADDRKWLVPVARALVADGDQLAFQCRLPCATSLDDNGEWRRDGVMPRYASIWSIAERWWDTAFPAEEEGTGAETPKLTFDFGEANDAAAQVLGVNYRLGRMEASHLGLLTEQSVGSILLALVDWPVAAAWLKKKAAAAG
jgi:hypothetical protein